MKFLRSSLFWIPFSLSLVFMGLFFAWELGYLSPPLPLLLRSDPTPGEIIFSIILSILIALNAGLFTWRRRMGTCPVGVRRATGTAGILGAAALLCPVCLALPATALGLGFSLTVLTPFVPLIQVVALILLLVSAYLLVPRGELR